MVSKWKSYLGELCVSLVEGKYRREGVAVRGGENRGSSVMKSFRKEVMGAVVILVVGRFREGGIEPSE